MNNDDQDKKEEESVRWLNPHHESEALYRYQSTRPSKVPQGNLQTVAVMCVAAVVVLSIGALLAVVLWWPL